MSEAAAFNRQLRRVMPRFERAWVRGVIRWARVAHQLIAQRTPIDTGRASASWNVSLNGANIRVQPPEYFNPGQPWLDGEFNVDQFMMGDSIHISNNLPYIRKLNDGHSQQAPKMFVEKQFAEAKRQYPEILQAAIRKATR